MEPKKTALANIEDFLRRVGVAEGLSFQGRRDLLLALAVEVTVWEREGRAELNLGYGKVLPALAAAEVTP